LDVIQRCEVAWWSGIQKFYGLPNGVSNATLALVFPQFSLVHRVLLGKVSLILRGLKRLDTLLIEALIYDRGLLFERHRVGFNQSIKDWGLQLGVSDLFLTTDRATAKDMLRVAKEKALDSSWEAFARMPSTALVASMVGDREGFFSVAHEASRTSQLGLRAFLLSVSGSLAQSSAYSFLFTLWSQLFISAFFDLSFTRGRLAAIVI
jgi:hypothetical protein